MTHVAIVILNWNTKEFLEKFLPPLIRHTNIPGVEIIVADSNSSDGSVEFMQQEYSQIRLIRLEQNEGYAGGYNRALAQVEADYYLLLNSDIEVQEKWLQPMISLMDNHPDLAACSPILKDFYNRDQYEYAGAAGGYMDRFGYTFCRGRIFHTTESVPGNLNGPVEVFWTTGACMMIRSEMFHEAGGFDEGFFAHMEEVDLCWRLKNKGYKLAVVPGSSVYHVGGGTLPKSNPFKTYLNFRNNLFLLYKNLPDRLLEKTIRKRMLLDGLSGLMFLAGFRFRDFAAVIRAHKAFRKQKNELKRYRESVQNSLPAALPPEVYEYALVFGYFLGGIKKFNDLKGAFAVRMDRRTID